MSDPLVAALTRLCGGTGREAKRRRVEVAELLGVNEQSLYQIIKGIRLESGRDPAAVAEFRKANPCPATGKVRGACPGWQVDHITPLKCGGPDAPANMQWLTVEQHKIKTAREAKSCRRPR